MSQANVEVVREGLYAWNRGHDAVKAFVSEWYAPDVAMYALEDTLESRIYRGREEILLRWMELREPWGRRRSSGAAGVAPAFTSRFRPL